MLHFIASCVILLSIKKGGHFMATGTEVEFRTLLTKEEYTKLVNKFKGMKQDVQTNHYFDTQRFSLKATDASLRVRERTELELTLKKKKGYNIQYFSQPINQDEFNTIKETGVLLDCELANEVQNIIGSQKVVNFMSLTTERIYLPYSNGILFIDKSTYLGVTDYELEYDAKNYHSGKSEFIAIISEFGIQYKKAEKKIKRAYAQFRKML